MNCIPAVQKPTKHTSKPDIETRYQQTLEDFDDNYDHAVDLWNIYVQRAENHDRALIETWRDDMSVVMIFAGLYSAGLSALLAGKYQDLQQNFSADSAILLNHSVSVLAQISRQLADNGSQISLTFPAPLAPFQASRSDVRVNICWFISLALSLSASLAATIIQQWVRDYMQTFHRYHDPVQRARACQFLFEGAMRWRIIPVVNTIPALMHISLFLFFFGLSDFLFHLDSRVGIAAIVVIAICRSLYLFSSLAIFINLQSPYQTPLSNLFWWIFRILSSRYRYRRHRLEVSLSPNLLDNRTDVAMRDSNARMMRDARAISWTIANITDDENFESFLSTISASFKSEWCTKVWKEFAKLQNGPSTDLFPDSYVPDLGAASKLLRHRTGRLVRTCIDPGLEESIRIRRARVCIDASLSFVLGFGDSSFLMKWESVTRILVYIAENTNYEAGIGKMQQLRHHTNFAVKWTCMMILAIRDSLRQKDIRRAAENVIQSLSAAELLREDKLLLVDEQVRELWKLGQGTQTEGPGASIEARLEDIGKALGMLDKVDDAVIELIDVIMDSTSGVLCFVPDIAMEWPKNNKGTTSTYPSWLLPHLLPIRSVVTQLTQEAKSMSLRDPLGPGLLSSVVLRSILNTMDMTSPYTTQIWRVKDLCHGGIVFVIDIFLTATLRTRNRIPSEYHDILETTLRMVTADWVTNDNLESRKYLIVILQKVFAPDAQSPGFVVRPLLTLIEKMFGDDEKITAEVLALLETYLGSHSGCTDVRDALYKIRSAQSLVSYSQKVPALKSPP